MKVDIESKNRLAAFLKFLVDMQYKPSYTFNRFFLSQSPPSSNKLLKLCKYEIDLAQVSQKLQNGYILALENPQLTS